MPTRKAIMQHVHTLNLGKRLHNIIIKKLCIDGGNAAQRVASDVEGDVGADGTVTRWRDGGKIVILRVIFENFDQNGMAIKMTMFGVEIW
ncbi:hypothetical protein GUJ93_ZPchr0006g40919 [Zizania palustris]|uniref:Uncharacterized protein n=1 Tax=Zizania palustris TaxID=103762 RepID=A0A8J5W3U5_ZIZPA|nr:hypothetical protein GUJ93_ZPchr0006g40919 [Zizania palustris]